MTTLLFLFVMVVLGLTQGMQPLIGYNYGAKRMDRVRRTLVLGIIAGTAVTTAGFAATLVCRVDTTTTPTAGSAPGGGGPGGR